ncbi:flavin-containing monooxygenase [Paenibacillus flagellatus]|uniref:Oxidoreductase n=1 Tax=Paenibacillus flagellatus TaxID=2211139 RepID=A0A2V5KDR8_9BACL|nr:NAD(P)/FAD-dependent oxidoreductase [Paenibacillus flagellatus]PYI57122.1 oxidoreductase [Paenibacillus flagellatus]
MKHTDVVVVGGGQAGLAIGYYLKHRGIPFLIVDANERTGDTWRNRYDSLHLFTPRQFDGLPGLAFPGKPNGLPSKDEAADYLEAYARHFSLPIQYRTNVIAMEQSERGFTLHTGRGDLSARQVVVATGPFHTPWIPAFAGRLPDRVVQLHSAAYRNPAQLQPGNVLVVGAGNSGAQIAVELARERNVSLSHGRPLHFKPLYMLGKSIFWYFDKLGLLKADVDSGVGAWLKKQPEQIYGLDLKTMLADNTIDSFPKAVNADETGIHFDDGRVLRADNVIWATGFRSDYRWIRIPAAFDDNGAPIHRNGVSPVEGLFFLGLPWQSCRGSALMGWVAEDARRLAQSLEPLSSALHMNK